MEAEDRQASDDRLRVMCEDCSRCSVSHRKLATGRYAWIKCWLHPYKASAHHLSFKETISMEDDIFVVGYCGQPQNLLDLLHWWWGTKIAGLKSDGPEGIRLPSSYIYCFAGHKNWAPISEAWVHFSFPWNWERTLKFHQNPDAYT
jgi:hypothetical protein